MYGDQRDDLSRELDHEAVIEYASFMVGVDKVGGGTLGRGYSGNWETTVYTYDKKVFERVPVRTGMPHTHYSVADMVIGEIVGEL